MHHKNGSKRSEHHLKGLLEEAFEDLFQFSGRGLRIEVSNLEARGSPIHSIGVAAVLYFLPEGSPFCCGEADCHIQFLCGQDRERLEQRIGLTQHVEVRLEGVRRVTIGDTQFDPFCHEPPFPTGDINAKDGLGRTALIRAAQRGYEDLFEELLEAGADQFMRDRRGKSAFEYLHKNHWLRLLYERDPSQS